MPRVTTVALVPAVPLVPAAPLVPSVCVLSVVIVSDVLVAGASLGVVRAHHECCLPCRVWFSVSLFGVRDIARVTAG